MVNPPHLYLEAPDRLKSTQVYDFVITFSQEADYIWRRKWTFVTLLFMTTRYLPFVDIVFVSIGRELTINHHVKVHKLTPPFRFVLVTPIHQFV
jgi:hypothetical protein